ncbi:MAG: 3-isopropylmalate dehydratase [Phototrophicales bacterium]|nr:MAG: 3-isopropylmalate dehydratase [Phototrophicales bacterium]RMG70729.1 MAG: 3-isopropylmalate dehydratase [Chloroflexota bacterium]
MMRCWVYGDDVNTDVIFPGKYTYTLKTPEEIAAKALEDLDPNFARHVRPGDVMVAGRNWGCGSSREQAVTALKYAGIQLIIAASFNGLYFRNCINQGIRPVVNDKLYQILKTGDVIEIIDGAIHAKGQIFPIPPLSPSVQAIIDAGGLVPMLRQRFGGVR